VEGEDGGEAHRGGRGEWDAVEEAGGSGVDEEAGGSGVDGGAEENGEENSGYALGCHLKGCG